jgi:hypothetical protein
VDSPQLNRYSKFMGTRTFALLAALSLAFTGCSTVRSGRTVSLINGHDFTAWRQPKGNWQFVQKVFLSPENKKHFAIVPGTGVMLNHPNAHTVDLLSQQEFGDCEVHLEFNVPLKSNSGIYLLGRYEVQIFDSWGVEKPKSSDCGGIYASCSNPKPDYSGRPPRVNASRPPGEWQSYQITFRAPRFDANGKKIENARFVKVVHNGVVIQENVEVTRPTCAARWLDEKPRGPIMLQGDHGPVAFRKLTVRPLD